MVGVGVEHTILRGDGDSLTTVSYRVETEDCNQTSRNFASYFVSFAFKSIRNLFYKYIVGKEIH